MSSEVTEQGHLQNKIQRQRIALQTLEKARGGVSVIKDQWIGRNEGYEAHTIEWGGHQWVRKDFYDTQVKARNDMAYKLSQAYADLQSRRPSPVS